MLHLEFLIMAAGKSIGPLSEVEIYKAFEKALLTEESLACVYSRRLDWEPPKDPRNWKPLRFWLPKILELPKPKIASPLEFVCVACATKIRIRDSAKSGTLKCPVCGIRLNVRIVDGAPKVEKEHEEAKVASSKGQETESPCQILGVSRNCSPQELKAAYRRKLKEYHPDRVADMGVEIQMLAERKTKDINWAYEQLCKGRSIT